MNYLIKDILDWHKDTFPNATGEAVWAKLLEEGHEFWLELINHENQSTKSETEMLDELADVFIVATRYIDMRSDGEVSILDIIEKKMERNKQRVWGPEEANGDRRRVK